MSPLAEPLRVAIVGAGLMGRWHADAAARAGARVVAVVDPDLARARALAARHRRAVVADDLGAAVRLAAPALVHVCTPLATHQSLASQAVTLGLHAVVEKPLAPDAQVTRLLLDQAVAQGVVLVPTHQFLFQAGVLRALAALPRIGPLRHVETVACTAGANGGTPEERDALVAEILPHPLALLGRLLPGPVAAVTWHLERAAPGEVRATGRSGDVAVSILVSTAGRPTRNSLHLLGERGSAHVDLFHGFAVIETGYGARMGKIARPFALASRTLLAATTNLAGRMASREPAYPGLRELIRRVYRGIETGGAPPVSAAETLDVAVARDAIVAQFQP